MNHNIYIRMLSEKELTESSHSRVKRGTAGSPDYPWGLWTTWGSCEARCGNRKLCRYRRCYTYDCGPRWKEEKYFQYRSCGAFAMYSWHFERVVTGWSSNSSREGEQWKINTTIQLDNDNDTVKQPFGYFYEIKGVYSQNVSLTTEVKNLPIGNYCFLGHLWKSGPGSVSLGVEPPTVDIHPDSHIDIHGNSDSTLHGTLEENVRNWPQLFVSFSIKHKQSVRLIVTARTAGDLYTANSDTVIRADDLHLLEGSCNSVWSPPESEDEKKWNSTECSCDNYTITYLRRCEGGQACLGDYKYSTNCTPADCTDKWRDWTYWSSCSESCGIGTKTRTRACSGDKCLDENEIGSKEEQTCDRSCGFLIGCTFENKQGCSDFYWQTDEEKDEYRWQPAEGLDPSFVRTYRKAPQRNDLPVGKGNRYIHAADTALMGHETSLQTRANFKNGTYCVEFDFHVSGQCELRLLAREQPKNRELFRNKSTDEGWHSKKVEVHGSGFTLDFIAIKLSINQNTIGVVSLDNIFIYKGSCKAKWGKWAPGKCIGYGHDSFRTRNRNCENGTNCIGRDRDIENCVNQPYPKLPKWGNCSASCGLGTRTRIYSTGKKEIGRCHAGEHCKEWGEWTPCTQSCGICRRSRTRNGVVQTENYKDYTVPIDCPVCGTWQAWTECDNNCGSGYRKRWRSCNMGGLCKCQLYDTARCFKNDCPEWNSWSVWQRCSSLCGTGYRIQQRTCKGGTTERCKGPHLKTKLCNLASCPEPSWLSWNAWSSCSQTCGQGLQYRRRLCSAGSTCVGRSVDTRLCLDRQCRAPCDWLPWLSWSPCSSTVERKRRTRDVRRGTSCSHTSQYEQIVPCTVTRNSAWGSWTSWSECTASCQSGRQIRSRICHAGSTCVGDYIESRFCNVQNCPAWSVWSEWSDSVTCGNGVKTRNRTCGYGSDCVGPSLDYSQSSLDMCPEWNAWGAWNNCSRTCGKGEKIAVRTCKQSQPLCAGPGLKVVPCFGFPCPVWLSWGYWSNCSADCGYSIRTRNRNCTGDLCPGSFYETEECPKPDCKDLGEWVKWTPWSPDKCRKTCGGGIQSRTGRCSKNSCIGDGTETRTCNAIPCPGVWGEWLDWSDCDCDRRNRNPSSGTRKRVRICSPSNCIGDPYEEEPGCTCPGKWGPWTQWGACSVTCGGGSIVRSRICTPPNTPNKCEGQPSQTKLCQRKSCTGFWGAWSEWSECSVTCGTNGFKRQTRRCLRRGACTTGPSSRTDVCTDRKCPGKWDDWTSWHCDVPCGNGIEIRNRTCLNEPHEGECAGPKEDKRLCRKEPCYDDWEDWSKCSTTCGKGQRKRIRPCTTPGCTPDPAKSEQEEECVIRPCTGDWSPWGPWSRKGTNETRSRKCLEPPCTGKEKNDRNCEKCWVPGNWGTWGAWRCDAGCGEEGPTERSRRCLPEYPGIICQGSPTEYGSPCKGGCLEKCKAGANLMFVVDSSDSVTEKDWELTKMFLIDLIRPQVISPNDKEIALITYSTNVSMEFGFKKYADTNAMVLHIEQIMHTRGSTNTQEAIKLMRDMSSQNTRHNIKNIGVIITDGHSKNETPVAEEVTKAKDAGIILIAVGVTEDIGDVELNAIASDPELVFPVGSLLDVADRVAEVHHAICSASEQSWGSWSAYRPCNATCGDGQQIRNRACMNNKCYGKRVSSKHCSGNCSVQWSQYSQCSVTCGRGTQMRTEICSPGKCTGPERSQARECNLDPCRVLWRPWSQCSVTCGKGYQMRTEICPSGRCTGEQRSEARECNLGLCRVQWGPWSQCSVTCGKGYEMRTEICPIGQCIGEPRSEARECDLGPCRVRWGQWSQCSASCGRGIQTRTETCSLGQCTGQEQSQARECNLGPCGVRWGPWSQCSVTCGRGTQTRTEICPSNRCTGQERSQARECNLGPCGVLWGQWSSCSETCGRGTSTRTEICQPGPCDGQERSQAQECNLRVCPVTVQWGQWLSCSVTCGKGTSTRTEICQPGQCNGQERSQARECNLRVCPVTVQWGQWSSCSVTCGKGTSTRTEICQPGQCNGQERSQARECNLRVCPVQWGPWSSCSSTCGKGTETRREVCPFGQCTGEERSQARECYLTDCPVFGPWSACSSECGIGIQSRSQLCLSQPCEAQSETRSCMGEKCHEWGFWSQCTAECGPGTRSRRERCKIQQCTRQPRTETSSCTGDNCKVWGPWTPCSESCGTGVQSQTERCSSNRCTGQYRTASRTCTYGDCRVWGAWSACSTSCGSGTQSRTERCPGNCAGQPKTHTKYCQGTCPVTWGPWSEMICPVTCGYAMGYRRRSCTSRFCSVQSETRSGICNVTCPVVCQNISDICFIMDSSGSVGNVGWEQSQNFIISLVQRLRIGPTLTRAALIIFSSSAHIEFDFNRYQSNSDVITAIRGLTYYAGGTQFRPALRKAREVFAQQRGARPEAKDIVVFLTDGEALDDFETEAQKVKEGGIIIFSVGVGYINQKQLETLASDKDYVFHASGFHNLTTIVDTVADRTCRSIQPVFGEWSHWSVCSVTCGQGIKRRTKACLRGFCSTAASESATCLAPACSN